MMNEGGKAFIHESSEPAAEPFHYTQCGLDDVYLLSGVTLKETAYGPTFNIRNIEGLHAVIAFALVHERKNFSAKDVRFLRKQMKLSQEQFGDLIGVGVQMVARYEKGESSISPASTMLLRAQYLARVLPDDETLREIKKLLAEIGAAVNFKSSGTRKEIYLEAIKGGTEWRVAA